MFEYKTYHMISSVSNEQLSLRDNLDRLHIHPMQ